MTKEENKALVRSLFDAVNTKNVNAVDELMLTDYVDNDAYPGQPQGREGYKQIFAYLLSAFPDSHLKIEDIVAEGDKVVVRSTWTGTHQGEFMGLAATGKQVSTTAINIYRIENGKLVEEWSGSRRSSPNMMETLTG